MLIGYARCSTDDQDLQAQVAALETLGVDTDRIYTDRGLSGKNRERPGLDAALAALREGDTLIVTKLDRLARSLPDATGIANTVVERGATLQFNNTTYDPTDPVGKLFFQMLAMIAEFERDLISQRTREGMAIAKKKGHLRGRAPKLDPNQDTEVRRMHDSGDYTIATIARLFNVDRASIHRSLKRTEPA